MTDPRFEQQVRTQRRLALRYGGLGLELAGGLIGFTLIGWLIDLSAETSPRYTLIGAVLGTVGGLYLLIKRSYEMASKTKAPTDEQRNQDSDRGE